MQTRREAIGTIAAVLAMGSGVIPARAQNSGGSVHVVVTPEPATLMQGLSQSGPTNMVAGNIYESLLRFDEKLVPKPSLAKSWTLSEDAKTYTFKLQSNVKWHDGNPFSADDVVFSLDKFLREVHPRWRPIANERIERIEKVDDETVAIHLKQPFGPLLLAMEVSSTPMVPKHIYDGTDYKTNPMNNTPIGTGPFKLKEWKRGSYIQLAKNPDYWLQGRPHLDEIYWEIIPDAASRSVAYRTAKVDVLTGGSVDILDAAVLGKQANSTITSKGWEMFAPHSWIAVNHRAGILGNKEFRRGLMHAVDRDFARDVVWGGFGTPATGPISSKTRFYSRDVKYYPFGQDKARKLIKASGYAGQSIKFLGLPYGDVWSRWAEAIKQNFADVGVNIEIVGTDVAGWVQKVGNWDFEMTFNFLYQLGDPAIGVSRSYVSSNIVKGSPFGNVGGYSNPEVDKLFDEAAIAPNDAKRQELYNKVQQILVEELPVLWMLELDYPTIYHSDIQNLVNTAIGVNDGFRDASKA